MGFEKEARGREERVSRWVCRAGKWGRSLREWSPRLGHMYTPFDIAYVYTELVFGRIP